jgi:hypothetical protein
MMSNNNQNQRVNGFNPLSYIGSNALQPTNFTTSTVDPTTNDSQNFNLGDWWLNTTNNNIWYLAATNNITATWISISGSSEGITELTGNTGGPVPPTAKNINVVGDGTTVNIVGNPSTSTLTMSLIVPEQITLTGNTGGAVSPLAGNINIVGSGDIAVTGNPSTHTLTISQSGIVADSFVTQSGTAVPVAGVLKVYGSNGISTTGAGSTVTIPAGSTIAQSFITSPATGTAIPAAGVLTFEGLGTTTVSAAGSTITISNSGGGSGPTYSEGSFTPFMCINGADTGIGPRSTTGYYVQIGNIVYITASLNCFPPYFGIGGNYIGIGGLPFTSSNSYGSSTRLMSAITSPTNLLGSYTVICWGAVVPNSTYLNFYINAFSAPNLRARQLSSYDINTSQQFLISISGFYYI